MPKSLADALFPKGSRLAHLYGLPKTHNPELSMRPIYYPQLEPTNGPQAKWLEEKSKPLSTNAYTIGDIFQFFQDIKNTSIDVDHILESYDVAALYTNRDFKIRERGRFEVRTVDESLGREHSDGGGKIKLRFVVSDEMSFSSSLI